MADHDYDYYLNLIAGIGDADGVSNALARIGSVAEEVPTDEGAFIGQEVYVGTDLYKWDGTQWLKFAGEAPAEETESE